MKTSLKRPTLIFGSVLLGLCLVGLGVSQADRSYKRKGFSAKDIRGNFGFALDGDITSGPSAGPIAGVGWLRNDSRGNSVAVRTLNVNGDVVLRQTAEGKLQVNQNGTGTAEYLVKTVEPMGFPDAVESFDFVITKDGDQVLFTSTTAGVVARGVSQRQ